MSENFRIKYCRNRAKLIRLRTKLILDRLYANEKIRKVEKDLWNLDKGLLLYEEEYGLLK